MTEDKCVFEKGIGKLPIFNAPCWHCKTHNTDTFTWKKPIECFVKEKKGSDLK